MCLVDHHAPISHKVNLTASDLVTHGLWNCLRNCEKIPSMGPKQHRVTFIRQWRKHRGLTLEQLAARLNDMAPSNLSMLERGLRGYTQETLERIAEELGTDAASLLIRDPADGEAIWSLWDHAKPGQKRQIVEIATTITKTGTDS
jgi:transcriptional regulator with XRE-family HTH domain